jgi:hypothetical protein
MTADTQPDQLSAWLRRERERRRWSRAEMARRLIKVAEENDDYTRSRPRTERPPCLGPQPGSRFIAAAPAAANDSLVRDPACHSGIDAPSVPES